MLQRFFITLRGFIALALAVVTFTAQAARADELLDYKPWADVKNAGIHLIDKEGRWWLLGGAVLIGTARILDEEAQEYFFHQQRVGDLRKPANEVFGTGVPGVLIGGGFWLVGDLIENKKAVQAGQAQLETLLLTAVATSVLKGAVNRQRPDSSDRFSFPSGHTSTVFASAVVLGEFYGWKAGLPMYLLGAVTAASRMIDNRHWFSDTAGGATLAILIGRAISKSHLDRLDGKEPSFSVKPVIGPEGAQIALEIPF